MLSRHLAKAANTYVNPLPNGASFGRLDQGIDYQGNPGDPVVAIGLAHIDAVKPNPGGFGVAIYYTLLNGPKKGTQIYVGHAQPTVRAGQVVNAGEQVATLLQHPLGNATQPGWTEIGIASGGAPAGNSTAPGFYAFVKNLSSGGSVTSYGGDQGQQGQQQQPQQQTDALPQEIASDASTGSIGPVVGPNVLIPRDTTAPGVAPGNSLPPNFETWRQLSQLPGASTDTMSMASLASMENNGQQ